MNQRIAFKAASPLTPPVYLEIGNSRVALAYLVLLGFVSFAASERGTLQIELSDVIPAGPKKPAKCLQKRETIATPLAFRIRDVAGGGVEVLE